MTSEQLVHSCFGVPLERSLYEIEIYEHGQCMAHVGLDRRLIQFKEGPLQEVAGVRFVCVAPAARRAGYGRQLMEAARVTATVHGWPYLVAFSDVQSFFGAIDYKEVRPRAMVRETDWSLGWPDMEWKTEGPEW